MNLLLEELSTKLFKKTEISGIEPLGISSVVSPEEKMPRRDADITKFFGESEGGFTYQKFKSIIKPSLGGLFGIGADARKKIEQFANPIRNKDEKGDVNIEYDEYIETFFIYLYYQLFVKLFSKQDIIISKNKESIKNAKDIVATVPDSLKPDMEENLIKLYRSFYSLFGSPSTDLSKMGSNKAMQISYFENFANQNIDMFTKYPLSMYMKREGTMNVKDFVGSMFNAVKSIDPDNTSNRQVMTIKMLSEFTKGSTADFDIVRFQELTKEYPSFLAGQSPINFPTKLEPIASDLITELSSIEDIDSLGMDWAKGTEWEPYIKLLCGIVALEEVSTKVKAAAKTLRKEKSVYQKKLDVGEQDGGVYFVNNQAFVEAADRVPKFKNIIDGLDKAISNVAKKTSYFQSKTGKELINVMFVNYDKAFAASDIEYLTDEKESLNTIMELTDLIKLGGRDFNNTVAEINALLFRNEYNIKGAISQRNDDAIQYAMANVGDFILPEITKDVLSNLSSSIRPDNVISAVKEIAKSTKEAFSKIFENPTSIDNWVKSFNDAFGEEFDFATMEKDGDKYVIKASKRTIHTFDNVDQLKEYVKVMSVSMGSIMYHSKVAFGKSGDKNSRYKEYFNVLTWFVNSLDEYGKGRALQTPAYPFVYLVTPFLLEVIKYSFRTYVNEIEDTLFDDGAISKDLRDRVKNSHKMDSMEDEEWKPIVEELSAAIEEYLKKK
jgi:hypothetical protein